MTNIRDLIKWFVGSNESLKRMGFDEKVKLQKLLYYSQAMHYAVYGTPLFNERIEAWIHGPVVREAYKEHEYTMIAQDARCASKEEIDKLFNNDVEIILKIVNFVYGSKTGEELEEISHSEAPWKNLEQLAQERKNPEIPKEEIKAYYASLKDVYEAYRDFKFDDEKTESINGNNFTYNFKETELVDDDYISLYLLGQQFRNKSFYIYKESDGSLGFTH